MILVEAQNDDGDQQWYNDSEKEGEVNRVSKRRLENEKAKEGRRKKETRLGHIDRIGFCNQLKQATILKK